MTDTFNLVPGTNEEKLLDNILRTAQGEQPQYNLVPSWRVEQYLAAIAEALSGGGGVLIVTATGGTLNKTWQEIVDAMSTTGAALAHYDNGSIDSLVTFKNASGDERFGEYIVSTGSGVAETYVASDPTGYPVRQTE